MGTNDGCISVFYRGGLIEIGATGGEETHTLTVEEMPSHHHSLRYGSIQAGGEESTLWIDYSLKKFTGNDAAAVFNVGGGQAHNNMPPYIGVCAWRRIK